MAEKTAGEARAFQMERQRNGTAQASDEHRKRLAAAEQAAETPSKSRSNPMSFSIRKRTALALSLH